MKRAILNVNQIPIKEGYRRFIFGMDIKNMYLSLKKEEVKKIVINMIRKSNFRITELDWKTMTIHTIDRIPVDRLHRLGLRS